MICQTSPVNVEKFFKLISENRHLSMEYVGQPKDEGWCPTCTSYSLLSTIQFLEPKCNRMTTETLLVLAKDMFQKDVTLWHFRHLFSQMNSGYAVLYVYGYVWDSSGWLASLSCNW